MLVNPFEAGQADVTMARNTRIGTVHRAQFEIAGPGFPCDNKCACTKVLPHCQVCVTNAQ